MSKPPAARHLVVVVGDQLNADSAAFDDFDKSCDVVWMAEVGEESAHVWSHKARIAIFLSAMRHFRDALVKKGVSVSYRELEDPENEGDLGRELSSAIRQLRPKKIVLVRPGAWRVLKIIEDVANKHKLPVEVRPDRSFYCSIAEFREHAEGRKQLRLEYFYRELRRRHDVLMDGKQPLGGKWNYDSDNRRAFGKSGPVDVPSPRKFRRDAVSKEVIKAVERRFGDHPGSLEDFDWPVTPQQAKVALRDFVEYRLCHFGDYQDAMWTEQPYLFHSRLSAAMNLKLISPRDVVQEAVAAYQDGSAPLNAVEGFVRQILGWREYVRGIYWLYMPDYLERNALQAKLPLPDFYWTGETEMNCLRDAIGQTLQYGYAHHIQRLMVTGLFGLLLGVDPKEMHRWYLAVYVDAVEWVELPNTLGMSQFADGGVMASKPYAATGKYIKRMSNYCDGCRFKPDKATGENACPFTTLYWDFLIRHEKVLSENQRMSLQVRNVQRKSAEDRQAISDQAAAVKSRYCGA